MVAQTLQMGGHIRTYRRNVPEVKPSSHSAAPVSSLPVPTGCLESISMEFELDLPNDSDGETGIVC